MRNRTQYIKALKNEKGKRYYKPLKYPNIPLSSNDIYIRTTVGDRLDSLAEQYYNDVRLWWIISTANPHVVRNDSYALKPNLEIRIPSNTNLILENFKALNK
tara:strand:+ start:4180 stop:4485 length:306 start_codon:yes stop_codon:yes gene_type:complete